MSIYSKWAKKEHRSSTWIITLLLAAVVFLFLLPWVIITQGPALDRRIGLPGFASGAANILPGGLLMIVGFGLAWWSIYVQLTRGRGTPVPLIPTQELLTRGPFRYCRNPMTLGTILGYSGIGVIVGTIAGIVLMLVFGALLLLYIKLFEEKELAERFGEAYLRYRGEVPFLIPRPPKRQ